MKLHQLFEQSKGQQVIAFARYLDDWCTCSEKNKELLEEFSAHLFNNGYTFSQDATSSVFTKGNTDDGEFRIFLPRPHRDNTTLQLFYFKDEDPNRMESRVISRHVILQIKPLTKMVTKLDDFIELANAAT